MRARREPLRAEGSECRQGSYHRAPL